MAEADRTESNRTGSARLLALLEALAGFEAEARHGLTVAELARALERDKSVVSRQVRPLVDLGVLERSDEGRHSLGWRLFAIAARAGDQRLLSLTPPVMRRLSQLAQERSHLNVRQGTDVLTILSESPHRAVEATGWVGRTTPVACTSSGRALLFDHSDAAIRELFGAGVEPGDGPESVRDVDDLITRTRAGRRAGFASVVAEFDADLSAVAAPVRDAHGRIVGALNISAPSYRLKERLPTAGRQVARAAAQLSRAMSSPPATET